MLSRLSEVLRPKSSQKELEKRDGQRKKKAREQDIIDSDPQQIEFTEFARGPLYDVLIRLIQIQYNQNKHKIIVREKPEILNARQNTLGVTRFKEFIRPRVIVDARISTKSGFLYRYTVTLTRYMDHKSYHFRDNLEKKDLDLNTESELLAHIFNLIRIEQAKHERVDGELNPI